VPVIPLGLAGDDRRVDVEAAGVGEALRGDHLEAAGRAVHHDELAGAVGEYGRGQDRRAVEQHRSRPAVRPAEHRHGVGGAEVDAQPEAPQN